MLIYQIKEELELLETEIKNIEDKLQTLPQGRISFYMNGKYVKWFHVGIPKAKLISKSKADFASKLAMKNFYEAKVELLKTDYSNLDQYLSCHESSETADVMESLLNKDKLYPLISKAILPEEDELSEWMNEDFPKNEKYPEQLKYVGISGNKLRSKSEVLIDRALREHKISFRYESLLQLGDIDIYPDFTIKIKNRKRGGFKTIIWEHFGMMDVPSYSQKAMQKIAMYNANGYLQGYNLITTFESNEFPLDMYQVNKIVELYLM